MELIVKDEKETLDFYFISFVRWFGDKQWQNRRTQIKSEVFPEDEHERKLAGT